MSHLWKVIDLRTREAVGQVAGENFDEATRQARTLFDTNERYTGVVYPDLSIADVKRFEFSEPTRAKPRKPNGEVK